MYPDNGEASELSFLVGTLIGEPLPFHSKKSVNSLYRGHVELSDKSTRSCILKDIPRLEFVNELVSTALARALGLPVPEVVLALVPDDHDQKKYFVKSPQIQGGSVVFSTVDVQVPNLTQRIQNAHQWEHPVITHQLLNWRMKSDLYGFDTWIANTDRHRGNILLSSTGQIWLVDHGRSFTKEDWSPADLDPNKIYANRLAEWYTRLMDLKLRNDTKLNLPIVEGKIKLIDLPLLLSSVFNLKMTQSLEESAMLTFLTQRVSRVASDASLAL